MISSFSPNPSPSTGLRESKVIKFTIKKAEPLRRKLDYLCDLVSAKIEGFDPYYEELAVEYYSLGPM